MAYYFKEHQDADGNEFNIDEDGDVVVFGWVSPMDYGVKNPQVYLSAKALSIMQSALEEWHYNN